MQAPDHIKDYIKNVPPGFPYSSGKGHFYYQIVCSCGSEEFRVFRSDAPGLRAVCCKCECAITVYDLIEYPAASKGSANASVALVRHRDGSTDLRVFVMYEYGELDADEEFDPNDITWCQVFVENLRKELQMVLDDETA
ncbi:MAG TPA: hypothetical protein VF773_13405 [Verrucomicrobiae bacterium]